MDLEQGAVRASGLAFSYLAVRPAAGPLALCFHGFPDSAWTFRHLLPGLHLERPDLVNQRIMEFVTA